jgi:hypothetical protein
MTLDPHQLAQVVKDEFGKLPHPYVPEITNADYPAYERVAAMKRNPHPPTPADVRSAFNELQAVQITPSQWEHAWTISRPLSNRMLGRDPTIQELVRHADAHPQDIHTYYSALPSPSHPEIQAGEMARYKHLASDPADRHLERAPLLREVAVFAAGKYHPDQIDAHYQRMKESSG